MQFNVSDIAAILKGEVDGDKNAPISTIASIETARQGAISFLSNSKYEAYIYTTDATAVIVSKDFTPKEAIKSTLIKVQEPYAAFSLLLDEYHKINTFSKVGIESPSYIGEESTYGSGLYLGAFAYIGKNVTIGNNAKIYPHVYIGDNTNIGNNCILYSGVKIYSNTRIGSYCTIQSGAVIGSDGFGFAPQADGSYKTIPQVGNVILEDHVDVGANTTIDCATFDSTIVKKGVKIDNLIQLAHNTEIGQNTVIAAQTGIAGSTKVGNNCIIGGQVGIVGHISIADGTQIQAQSGVSKKTSSDQKLYGSPAIDYNNYVRSYAVFRRLPELLKQIQQLEEKILALSTVNKNA